MKLRVGQTIRVGFAFLAISAFWQMYNNIVPLLLTNTFHLNETFSGVIMAMDNVLALFLLPLFGTLSDRCRHPLGRRRPFIKYGTIASVVIMMFIPVIDNYYAVQPDKWLIPLFVAVLGFLLISMGTYRSPAVALMPDVTPKPLRSKANAIINLMGAVGGILYLIIASVLYSQKRTAGLSHVNYLPIFLIIGSIMILCMLIVLLTVDEVRLSKEVQILERQQADQGTGQQPDQGTGQQADQGTGQQTDQRTGQQADQGAGQQADRGTGQQTDQGTGQQADQGTEQQQADQGTGQLPDEGLEADSGGKMSGPVRRSLIFLLISVAFWFISYNAVETWFTTYASRMWNMSLGSASLCLTIATAGAILTYIPAGNIASKIGRKKTILGGVVIMMIAFAAAFAATLLFDSFHPVLYAIFIMVGIGWASINTNSFPMVVEMCRGSDVGRFTGMYYTFSMAAQIVTPVLAGFFMNRVSYNTLFVYSFVTILIAFFTMQFVKHGDSKVIEKKGLEAFDFDE